MFAVLTDLVSVCLSVFMPDYSSPFSLIILQKDLIKCVPPFPQTVSFFDFSHLQAAQQGAEETARITSFTVNGLMSAISTG